MSKLENYSARLRCGAVLLLAAAAAFDTGGAPAALAKGTSYEVLYNFRGEPNDGAEPWPNLIRDKSGNLYGTTYIGGASDKGSVFKVTASGTETVLYSFTGGNDGAWPDTALLEDSAGNFYGACFGGGSDSWGTVFKVAPDGTETTLYTFTGGLDGAVPFGALIADSGGNLYGTTRWGGSRLGFKGDGTVFEIRTDGAMKVLHTFTPGSGGTHPTSGLLEIGGDLFGTAANGGAHGAGTVFDLARGKRRAKSVYKVLYSFKNADGKQPDAALIHDSAGNIYGTTALGGASGDGVVFKLAPDGTETVLHSFASGSDGSEPISALIADREGNLYGTTTQGGASNSGIVFKLAPDGTETVLHAFSGPRDDGASPTGSLIGDGAYLYGTTQVGGSDLDGTVFRIKK